MVCLKYNCMDKEIIFDQLGFLVNNYEDMNDSSIENHLDRICEHVDGEVERKIRELEDSIMDRSDIGINQILMELVFAFDDENNFSEEEYRIEN